MAIGGSDGSWFEDEFDMLANRTPYTKFDEDEAFKNSLVPITHDEELKDWISTLPPLDKK